MARLTEKLPDGQYTVDADRTAEAIQRLGQYEDLAAYLQAQVDDITREMDALRLEGKEKTVKFRELLGNKLLQNNMLAMFKVRGLDV